MVVTTNEIGCPEQEHYIGRLGVCGTGLGAGLVHDLSKKIHISSQHCGPKTERQAGAYLP